MKMAYDADSRKLSRQQHLPSDDDELTQVDHITVGSFYELDPSPLPPHAPIQLQSVRIVMVCTKSGRGVTVRYPSSVSLKSHFNRAGNCGGGVHKARLSPEMDEKYTMGFPVAAEALFKRIKPEEYVAGRGMWRFWSPSPSKAYQRERGERSRGGGGCLTALTSGKELRWGKRLRVRFENPNVITPQLYGEEKGKEESENEEENGASDDEDDVAEEEVKDEDEEVVVQLRRNGKRKCSKGVNYNLQKTSSRNKAVEKPKRKLGCLSTVKKQSGRPKESICRWSKDR